MSKGKEIIGNVNPTDSPDIREIKQKFVELIDFLENKLGYLDTDDHISGKVRSQANRRKAVALTKLEEACMFAVKSKSKLK